MSSGFQRLRLPVEVERFLDRCPMRLRKILGRLSQIEAKSAGYRALGFCGHCGMSARWAAHHYTFYSAGSGCFPLCARCGRELSITEKLPYYYDLWKVWEQNRSDNPDLYEEYRPRGAPLWQMMKDAVLAEEAGHPCPPPPPARKPCAR